MNPNNAAPKTSQILGLQYPRSLGTYQTSTEAQTVVDRLSDAQFPVEKIRIVGTDLRQIERVTGRLTWTKVILSGLLQGVLLGLFIGLLFALFSVAPLAQLLAALVIGAFFGVVMSALSYAMSGGRRDFTSVTMTVPMRYEILTEHNVVDQALTILREAGRPDAPQAAPATGPTGQVSGPTHARPAPAQQNTPETGSTRPSNAPSFGQPAPQQEQGAASGQGSQGQYGQPGPSSVPGQGSQPLEQSDEGRPNQG